MTDERLLDLVTPWIEGELGVPVSAAGVDPVPVVAAGSTPSALPLRALKFGHRGIVAARPEWTERLEQAVDDLPIDLLFSITGAYDLGRVTLPDGVGVWGPAWYYFADEKVRPPADDGRPVQLTSAQLAEVDYDFFWHCERNSLAGFGVYDGGKLVALASVWDDGEPVWEIGMDVDQSVKGGGLGRAVVRSAINWILDSGRIALATTASFNVPSARTLRGAGLRYVFSVMNGAEGVFRVPPAPLGAPYPGAEVYNFYPEWATNQDIKPRP